MTAITDFKALSADYAQYHTHPLNRLCHAAGIPLIMLCVVRWTQSGGSLFPWAALVLPLYAVWDSGLAFLMALTILGMAALAPHLGAPLVFGLFVLGWLFQFIGHGVFEKRSPAFMTNLVHLLVGPMWILGEFSGPLFPRRK